MLIYWRVVSGVVQNEFADASHIPYARAVCAGMAETAGIALPRHFHAVWGATTDTRRNANDAGG